MKIKMACLCALLLVTGCNNGNVASPPHDARSSIPDTFEQAWVMSSGWCNYMGVAIALTRDRYYYWFYSDVPYAKEPDWPIVGTYRNDGGTITLSSNQYMYATSWMVATNGNRQCLWAEHDVGDYPRLLIPDPHFDPKAPFQNQAILRAEPPDGGDGHYSPNP